jgi:hypothetical protein
MILRLKIEIANDLPAEAETVRIADKSIVITGNELMLESRNPDQISRQIDLVATEFLYEPNRSAFLDVSVRLLYDMVQVVGLDV